MLSVDWSPEEVANVQTKARASISHEWIYHHIGQDKRQGGKLYRHLRQYVKKGRDLRTVTDDDIQFAQSRINNHPKKCLGFKQPAVIFKEMAMAA
ncbi:hypothetical protein UB42_00090 [Photobacterium leiognathi]|nr:hypothetical protein UB42_00090 [Photobacterium leiognathi]